MAQEPAETSETAAAPQPAIADQIPDFADWLPAPLQPYWEMVAQYPIIGAGALILLFYFAALLVRAVLIRTIHRLTKSTETEIDDQIIQTVSRPIFNTVFLIGLTFATVAARLPAMATTGTINVLLSIIIVIWMKALFRLCAVLLRALTQIERFKIIEDRTVPLFDLVAKLGVILVGSYALLMIWGINPAGWLASAGIVGIAVGFAARDTLANLFSGFFILADAPYTIGDYVNLDSGERGKVTHVGMRSTRLLTRDDIEITVPNAVIANAKIINESGGPYTKMRVRVAVGTAYGSDVDQVCEVLEKVAADHAEICRVPAARVRMRNFGASSLDFELLCWIDHPENRGRIRHELYMNVYKAFGEADIEIPYAKQDLYIKELPAQS